MTSYDASTVMRRIAGLAWRAGAFFGGLFLAFATYVGLIFGACFDGGGFCGDEFGASNREAFYTAIVLSFFVGPLLVIPFTRNWRWLAGATALTFGLTVALVIALWP